MLTAPEYHGRLSVEARDKFFRSGVDHIDTMFSIIRQRLDPTFAPERVLDFGCGVGRLLLPLANRCREVTGCDVSSAMLAEARRNCDEAGASNVTLTQNDDDLQALDGGYDFIHSFIVLQHIAPNRGEHIVRKLVAKLCPGGIAMFHISYSTGLTSRMKKTAYWMRVAVPGANMLLNLLRGKPADAPIMQMNTYSVTRLLDILRSGDCREVHVRFSDHGGARGVLLFARKAAVPIFA